MSVFKGTILEYPGIVVDRFNSSNCKRGRAFFLSHCHKDHMSGLDSDDLLITLREYKVSLYCSEVTQALLENDPEFVHLTPFLKSVPIEEPINLALNPFRETDTFMAVVVTLIPAGHCPGSVMFLFQGDAGNVLYTGDFRLSLDEVKKCQSLHTQHGKVLELETVYLDTTFCHPRSNDIITRNETRDIITNKAKEWLSQSTSNVVHLNCRSFGYEHIFLAMAKQFDSKIHIAQWRMKAYSVLPSVHQCLTLDGNSTRIHACNYKKGCAASALSRLPCGSTCEVKGQPLNVLHIKPSTQWFVTSGKKQPYMFIPETNLFRVMHSMHASYSELTSFIKYLSPASIVPCVIPASLGDTSIVDLHSRLRSLLPSTGKMKSLTSKETICVTKAETKLKPNYNGSKKSSNAASNNKKKEVDLNSSDYETDDEFASDLSEHSFTYNLPGLTAATSNTTRAPIDIVQPVISLTFEEYIPDCTSTPSTKRMKLATDELLTDGDTDNGVQENNDTAIQKNGDIAVQEKSNDSDVTLADIEAGNLSFNTASDSSDCKNISSHKLGTPPPIFIDLTQTSDHTDENGSDRITPDSVIVVSDSHSPVEQVCIISSSSDSSTHSNTHCSRVSISPSNEYILPPTPGKERVESILSKRKLTFM